ncbi:hypothetical protein [Caballeronia sp. BR00000012568055]|uniref:hypothetical protein n=1 Tax=Caballeronia sp. BR00000012568055 TaxID=2918761 RepID=UPI0023F77CA1|nr:hypothetical protein [Caballeronia sp. BR00000012568055]
MSEVQSNKPIVFHGPFRTNQEHSLPSQIFQSAADSYMEVANRIAVDMISDNSVRKQYQRHIKIISDDVKAQVAKGKMTSLEGAQFCNQMRDQLFAEYRKWTSAQGVAEAEAIKLKARGFDYYLNKYAQESYHRPFAELSQTERGTVYYKVIEAAGRDNAKVTAKAERLVRRAKVMILITAILAVWEITNSKDKIREAARQGNIIAAGMIGGAIAGGAVSFICGPAEPMCAIATVAIGSNVGGMVGQVISDIYEDELQFFNSFVWH